MSSNTAAAPQQGKHLGSHLFDDADFVKRYRRAEQMTGEFGVDLLQQMKLASYTEPVHLLDLACGTGIVTKNAVELLAKASPPTRPLSEDHFTCSDLAAPMLGALKSRIQSENWPITAEQIDIATGDMRDTKLPSDAYTHLTCSFGPVMAPDPPKTFRECHRVLKPGGIGGWTVWQTVGWHPPMVQCYHDIRSAAVQKCEDGTATEEDQKLSQLPPPAAPGEFMARFAGHDLAKLRSEGVQESDLPRWDKEDFLKSGIEAAGFSNVNVSIVEKEFTITADDVDVLVKPVVDILSIPYTPEQKKAIEGADVKGKVQEWWDKRFQGDDVHDGKLVWKGFVAMVVTGEKAE